MKIKSNKKNATKKEWGYNFYIPKNINIDELLERYPLDVPNAKDYLSYIMHLIHSVPAFKKDVSIEDTNGFTTFHSTFLQNRVKSYPVLIEWLLERGILETDNYYVGGKK